MLLGAMAIVVAGCGSHAPPKAATPKSLTHQAPPSSPAPSRTAPVNQVVARASTALNRVRSFHLHESEIDHSGRRLTFDADFVIPGHVAFRESVGNEVFSVKLLDGYNYLNGNAAFWRSQGSSSALAKRWTREPASAAPEFEQFRQLATPPVLGRCLAGANDDDVKFTPTGRQTVNGIPTLVLHDQGTEPGSQASQLFLATDGSSLPVRVITTGGQRLGRAATACPGSIPRTTSRSSVTTFSHFNRIPSITIPPGH
jgi:hypothetical protein